MKQARGAESPHKIVVNAWTDCATCYEGDTLKVQIGAKCLEGCSLTGKGIIILDDTGRAVSRTELAEAESPGGLHPASATLAVSALPGRHAYNVVAEPDEGHLAGQKLVHVTVLPDADRKTTIRVVDEKTGKALPAAAIFFFDGAPGNGRPLSVETDENGEATVALCSTHSYEVRVEYENYNEGGCSLEAGCDPVDETVTMLSVLYNKEVLGRPGYDPY